MQGHDGIMYRGKQAPIKLSEENGTENISTVLGVL